MMRMVMVVVLMVVAGGVQAQRVVKCTQADGSVAYQQTSCATSDAQEALTVKAPPPPTPVHTRRMVQAFDPATGVPTEAWIDGPAPPDGGFYITREFRTVVDPQTGRPREAWVEERHALPQPPAHVYPQRAPEQPPDLPPMPKRYNPERSYNAAQDDNYYRPSDSERRKNGIYERQRCIALGKGPDC